MKLKPDESKIWYSREYGSWRFYKNGKPKDWDRHYSVTWLVRCDRCGLISTPKRVQGRYVLGFSDLCMSCWNRLKPISNQIAYYEQCKKLVNQIRREARKPK